jgi:TolB-like protein
MKFSIIVILIGILFFLSPSTTIFAEEALTLDVVLDTAADQVYMELSAFEGEKTVAIYPFTCDNEITQFGEYLVDEIENKILARKDKDIKLLNRANIETLLEEHEFQLSTLVDKSTQVLIGKKISAHYIITGSYYLLGDQISVNIKILDLKTGETLHSSSSIAEMDDRIQALLDSVDDSPGNDETASSGEDATELAADFQPPPYRITDTFDVFDRDLWMKQSVDKDLTLEVKDGRLQITGGFRDGRLNSINSFTTKAVKVKSFAVEISFRDVKASADTIRLTVGNVDWMRGGYLQVTANFKKEYYDFFWAQAGTWYSDDEHFVDELFGDEDQVFHTLKIVYDKESKTAYGYVDDILIDIIPDFSFLPRDKVTVSVSMAETVQNTKKDILVEFDNFKTSLDLKK